MTTISRSFYEFLGFLDVDFKGLGFTWRGNQNRVLIQERMDQGLIISYWQEVWPNTITVHATVLGSNHCPIIVQRELDLPKGKKRFRFEAF